MHDFLTKKAASRPATLGKMSSDKGQLRIKGGVSLSNFHRRHANGENYSRKFLQKKSVGENYSRKRLRQPSAGAYGPKRRRRKGKRSFGGRGKTVNEKRNAGHTQANPTCTRHNNSTIQRFNRAKPSTTQRAKGANNSTRQRR